MEKFTKSDLKTGMLVEFRNGDTGRVFINVETNYSEVTSFIVKDNKLYSWLGLHYFNNNLEYNGRNNNDIVKVYSLPHPYGLIQSSYRDIDKDIYYKGRLLYNRENTIEITVKVNGKSVKLSDISKETLLKIREQD